jgi:hypothetical protein
MSGAEDRERLLSEEEAAAEFGVSPSTFARWARAGKVIPASPAGAPREYRAGHVRALRDGTEGPAQAAYAAARKLAEAERDHLTGGGR